VVHCPSQWCEATEQWHDPGMASPATAMFPLSTVVFPEALVPLHIFEDRYRQLTADCIAGSGEFGIVLITRGPEVGGGDQRSDVGTVVHIESAQPFPDGRWGLVVLGRRRVRVRQWLDDAPYPLAEVEEAPTSGTIGDSVPEALADAERAVRRARALLSELGRAPAIAAGTEIGETPEVAAWRLCALAPMTPHDAQRLLDEDDLVARMHRLTLFAEEVSSDTERFLATRQH